MAKFAVSEELKKLKIGFALDEGLASEGEAVPLYYGERNVFWVNFVCRGECQDLCSGCVVQIGT